MGSGQLDMFGGGGPERVAIFGSRDWDDPQPIIDFIGGLPKGTVVVSGGARGVDSIAEEYALKRGLVVAVCRPPWDALGRRAGAVRNKVIVDISHRGVAFWDGKSRGTMITVEMFHAADKPVQVVGSPVEEFDPS